MAADNEFGIIGLGRIGAALAHRALEKGIRVAGMRRRGPPPDLVAAGMVPVRSMDDFRAELHPPRVIFLYIPAGPAVDSVLDELAATMDPGDIVVDGGNSYWGDSIRRHHRMQAKGLQFVDVGTSGGIAGARQGACFMVGGEHSAVDKIAPLLRALATEGGYVHAGGPGAGHFVKLVHNGIEFGMLQAIGEGFDLLRHYHAPLDIGGVLQTWRNGSVIRSWLVDLLAQAYGADPKMQKPSGYVEDTGEVNWLVSDALRMEVPIPVIAQSVMQLLASRDRDKDWARAIVMMRHGFGGHPYGPEQGVARERREGRVGNIFRPEERGEGE